MWDWQQACIAHKERTYGIAVQAGHFLRHLLEMILAMFVGMAVGGALALWAARMIGYSDPACPDDPGHDCPDAVPDLYTVGHHAHTH